MYVVERGQRTFERSARQLSSFLYKFLMLSRRERIIQRTNVENYAAAFSWDNLLKHYQAVYKQAVKSAAKGAGIR
jgi:glycogen(starch) synthase